MVFVSVHLVRDVPSYVAGTVLASSVPRPRMRIKQKQMLLLPPPGADHTGYLSQNVRASGGWARIIAQWRIWDFVRETRTTTVISFGRP
jgi:hypothetical protein